MLDWTIAALKETGVDDIVFVGGYHIEKVVDLYAGLRFYFDPTWAEGSEVNALLAAAPELNAGTLVFHSDLAVRPEAFRKLMSEEADVAIGRVPGDREKADVHQEPVEAVYLLSVRACEQVRSALPAAGNDAISSETIAHLIKRCGLKPTYVDISTDCLSIDTPSKLSRFVFGTKAQTLERLKPVLTTAKILDQVRFTVSDWRNDPSSVLDQVAHTFLSPLLVVRSSALSEDRWVQSQAGRFHSELGVNASNGKMFPARSNRLLGAFQGIVKTS